MITLAGSPAPRPPLATLFRTVAPVKFLSAATATLEGPARACNACPRRRPYRAILRAFGLNVVFNLAARIREEDYEYKVTPSSWWANLRHGFEGNYNRTSWSTAGSSARC